MKLFSDGEDDIKYCNSLRRKCIMDWFFELLAVFENVYCLGTLYSLLNCLQPPFELFTAS